MLPRVGLVPVSEDAATLYETRVDRSQRGERPRKTPRLPRRRVCMTTQGDEFDARQAARDELAPDGKTLALMLENIVAEGEQQIRYIRGKLRAKADSSRA